MKQNMLHKQQKPGFKVPENYFRDFEANLMAKLNEDYILDDTYKGDPGFKTPESYFDDLENRVLNNIENTGKEENKGKVIPLFRNRKLYYIAAVAAVFIGIVSTLLFNPISPEFSFDSIELTILEKYIDDGHIDFDYYEISNFIIEENYSLDNFNTIGISDEEVFNYLDQNMENKTLLYK